MRLRILESDESNIKTITTIEELMEILESGEYNYYGLRGATKHDIENINRGYLDCSYNWVDGDKTDEQLNGTCAISVGDFLKEKELLRRYHRIEMYTAQHDTDTILLIADNNQEYGEDENEVILGSGGYGADVLAIVDI